MVLNFGTPWSSDNYTELHTNGGIIRLKQDVFSALTTLTTPIDSEDYDVTVKNPEELNTDFLDPEAVNRCVSSGFEDGKVGSKKSTIS